MSLTMFPNKYTCDVCGASEEVVHKELPKGWKTIGLAYQNGPNNWTMLGLANEAKYEVCSACFKIPDWPKEEATKETTIQGFKIFKFLWAKREQL